MLCEDWICVEGTPVREQPSRGNGSRGEIDAPNNITKSIHTLCRGARGSIHLNVAPLIRCDTGALEIERVGDWSPARSEEDLHQQREAGLK